MFYIQALVIRRRSLPFFNHVNQFVVGSHSCLSVRLFTSGYGLTVLPRPRSSPPVIDHRWTSMSSSVITLNHPSSLFHRSLQLSSLKKKHALLKYRFLFEEKKTHPARALLETSYVIFHHVPLSKENVRSIMT